MSRTISLHKSFIRNDVLINSLLLVVCVAISLGGSLRLVGTNLGVICWNVGNAAVPVEAPAEEAPLESESPVEAPGSEGLTKGEEADRCSVGSHSKKRRSRPTQACVVEQLYAGHVSVACRIVHSRSEHSLRNGCGATLRC